MTNRETTIPSDELRPWYYNRLVLIPTFILAWPLHPSLFILWPAWAVLILRSPWHRNIWLGALAWANLFSGVYVVGRLILQDQVSAYQLLAYIVPGLLLTVFTQLSWTKKRREVRAAQERAAAQTDKSSPPMTNSRHRLRRRRSPRPGRHSGPRSG